MSRYASGMRAWIFQRLTALYLVVFSPVILWHFMTDAPADFITLKTWITDPLVGLGIMLGLLSLLLHAWIGIRDILIDYIKPFGLRLALLTITAAGLIVSGLWGLQIILLTNI